MNFLNVNVECEKKNVISNDMNNFGLKTWSHIIEKDKIIGTMFWCKILNSI